MLNFDYVLLPFIFLLPFGGRGSSPVLLDWRGLQFMVRPSNCHVSYLLKYNKILFFSLKINKN
jgi:hypothetical protein